MFFLRWCQLDANESTRFLFHRADVGEDQSCPMSTNLGAFTEEAASRMGLKMEYLNKRFFSGKFTFAPALHDDIKS